MTKAWMTTVADDEGIGEEGMGDAMTSPSVELAVGGSSFII